MGQQQLLLIVLSVIIVGVSVVVGINLFATSAGQANQDAITQDLLTVGTRAQQWYRKPATLAGGGNSFAVLADDAAMTANLTWPTTNENGTYSVQTAGTATQVVFRAVGVEDQDGNGTNVTIDLTATRDNVTINIVDR